MENIMIYLSVTTLITMAINILFFNKYTCLAFFCSVIPFIASLYYFVFVECNVLSILTK